MGRKRKVNTNIICSIDDCEKYAYCKGKCSSHYNRDYKLIDREYTSEYNLIYKKTNKDVLAEYERKYASTDKGRFNKAKSKAKIRKLDFALTFEEFVEVSNLPCYYCNDQLCGKTDFQGAHLDRIDNTKGYVLDNVISCGIICNTIRMDILSVEETKDAINGILLGRERRNA